MSTADLTTHATRLRRRRRIINHIASRLTLLRIVLFIIGYTWLLLLPWKGLSRPAWIDENALQPGQVNVEWNWGDVKTADRYLEKLEDMWKANTTSRERADYIQGAFRNIGLEAGTQQYSFATPLGGTDGVNAYGLSRSSRSSGTEAMVIATSWISRQKEGSTRKPNLRGVAMLLALVEGLSRQHVWAKDLIFLVSDSYLDGAYAWLSAYHGSSQKGMLAEPLEHPEPAGVIWTALVLDYPGHSFSHLGLFFEGTNGRLPNQDLSNSASTISRSMGVPWVLYDHNDDERINLKGHGFIISLLIEIAEIVGVDVQDYLRRGRNILRNIGYQATGEPSGVHGVFHKYRIDAITLYALPARGPHGFHSLGRVVESLLRTSNNLLERLHASFFFYLFTAPGEFAEFARYLPPVIILGLAASFGGLKLYVETGWTRDSKRSWVMRDRPAVEVLCIMAGTHVAGLFTLWIVQRSWFWRALEEYKVSDALDLLMFPSVIGIFLVWVYAHMLYPREDLNAITALTPETVPSDITKPGPRKPKQVSGMNEKAKFKQVDTADPIITPLTPLFSLPQFPVLPATTPALLKALNLCTLGAVVSVLAVANFSLSAVISILAILPLCLVPVSLHRGSVDTDGVEKDEQLVEGWRVQRIKVAGMSIRAGDVISLVSRVCAGVWVLLVSPMGLFLLAARIAAPGLARQELVEWMKRMMWESTTLKTWFVPIVCVLYLPLVLQGFIVCLLPA